MASKLHEFLDPCGSHKSRIPFRELRKISGTSEDPHFFEVGHGLLKRVMQHEPIEWVHEAIPPADAFVSAEMIDKFRKVVNSVGIATRPYSILHFEGVPWHVDKHPKHLGSDVYFIHCLVSGKFKFHYLDPWEDTAKSYTVWMPGQCFLMDPNRKHAVSVEESAFSSRCVTLSAEITLLDDY